MGCNRSGAVRVTRNWRRHFRVKDRPIRLCVPRYGVTRLQTLIYTIHYNLLQALLALMRSPNAMKKNGTGIRANEKNAKMLVPHGIPTL